MIALSDALTLGDVRRTNDGYLATSARVARTGIQEYLASELGDGFADRPGNTVIRVYRPPSEVMSDAAMSSFAFRPVTVDHPSEPVTADNWRKHSVGITGGDIDGRDGKFITVPMVLMDASAIRAVEGGKRQLSMGYTCDISPVSGVTDDGLHYDATQSNIRGNHLAIVGLARGGPELKIGDQSVATKTIAHDGINIEFSDQAADAYRAVVAKVDRLTTELSDASTKVGTLTATVSTKDGEIAALASKLKDAEMTPAKLDAAVAARGKIVDAAKVIAPTLDATGKTDAEIKRAAVAAKIGDTALALDDAAINGAFTVLSATTVQADGLANGIRLSGQQLITGDAMTEARKAREARFARFETAHEKIA